MLQIRGEDLILDAAAAALQLTLCFQSGTYLTLGTICMAADCDFDVDGRAPTTADVPTEPPPVAVAPPLDPPTPAVTAAPVTQAPATKAPATAKPTARATAAPVATAAPTVKATVKVTAAPTSRITLKPTAAPTIPVTAAPTTAAPTTAVPTTAAPTEPAPAAAVVTGQLRLYCDSAPAAAALQSGIADALGEGIELVSIASSALQPVVAVQGAAPTGSVRRLSLRQLAASSYIDVAFTAQYDPATTAAASGAAVARVLNILDSKANVIAAAVGQPASSVVIMTAQYCLAGLTSCPEASRLRMPPSAGTGRTAPATANSSGKITALGYAAMPILAAMTLAVLGCCAGLLLCCTRHRRTRKRANTGRKGVGAFLQLASPASSSGSGAAALGCAATKGCAANAQDYDDDDEFIARSRSSASGSGSGGAATTAAAAAGGSSSKYSEHSPDAGSSAKSGNPFLEPLDSPARTSETRSRRTRSGVSSDDGSFTGTRSASNAAARQSLVEAGYPAPPTTRAPFEGGGFEVSHRGPGGTQGVLRAEALQERDDRDLSDANRYI
jgi:hypothetical protein